VLFGPFLKENAGKWPQMMKKLNIFVTFFEHLCQLSLKNETFVAEI
jgi:hypothetical protein